MSKVMSKIPGVTSFTRRAIISDGVFTSLVSDGENVYEKPVTVNRHGIRGTQNINNTAKRDPVNIQITETARTDVNAEALIIRFNLRFLPLDTGLHSCAVSKEAERELTTMLKDAYDTFMTSAIESNGLTEVSMRTARNILNGRWLWRNRSLGQSISITVTSNESTLIDNCDALSIPLNNFDNYTSDEQMLGGRICSMLKGQNEGALSIEAKINLGFKGSVEVFPSQNYLSKKPDGFARPLYKLGIADKLKKYTKGSDLQDFEDIRVMGQAAMRDQKIGNALRTIDTWYPDAKDQGYRPIPVEPEGANLESNSFFRKHSGSKCDSAFAYLSKMSALDPNSEQGMFLIASFMRGGVFGESTKN